MAGFSYPSRDSHFAHKFTRLIFRCCLANDIGPEACYLLTQIAHTEDAARYRGPVTFFNEQLVAVVGLANVQALIRVRTKAVESGWLGYIPGAKGRGARYWVQIPDSFRDIPDSQIDCSSNELDGECYTENDIESVIYPETIRNESVMKAETIRKESDKHSTLSLSLSLPLNTNTRASGESTDEKPSEQMPEPTPEQELEPDPEPAIPKDSFANWYAVYPRKTSRGSAEKAFPKAIAKIVKEKSIPPPEAFAWLMEVTRLFAASPKAKGPYVPHPATFLNSARYDDDQRDWHRDDRQNGGRSPPAFGAGQIHEATARVPEVGSM